MAENNSNSRLETPPEDLPDNTETLQKGLKILAHLIARSILANANKNRLEKLLKLNEGDENLS